MNIRQADIARALNVSPMTVSRAVKALGREGEELTEYDAMRVLIAAELQEIGLAPYVSMKLLSEFSGEVRYIVSDLSRRVCWITFINGERSEFRLASLSPEHFLRTLARFRLALVVPLHELAQRAAQRLASIQKEKVA